MLTLEEPKLRYAVGDDAVGMIAGRACVSDDTYVALGRHESDEAYFAELMSVPLAAQGTR